MNMPAGRVTSFLRHFVEVSKFFIMVPDKHKSTAIILLVDVLHYADVVRP